jgi:hypothetical protein
VAASPHGALAEPCPPIQGMAQNHCQQARLADVFEFPTVIAFQPLVHAGRVEAFLHTPLADFAIAHRIARRHDGLQ